MAVLYLQEKTQIIGMHPNRRLFARSIVDYAAALNAYEHPHPYRNVGVWEFVGMTGPWARVLGLYELSDGWNTFAEMTTQIMKEPSPELAATYRAVEARRSGGVDEILEPLDGCPTYEDLKQSEASGILLVLDEVRVAPGAEEDYGAVLIKEWLPLAAAHGHNLVGVYRGALTDGLVVSYWATSLEDYSRLMNSGEAARWRRSAQKLRQGWRQELWTAASGSRFCDESFDYGNRDIREG